jgi:hypothetical protein
LWHVFSGRTGKCGLFDGKRPWYSITITEVEGTYYFRESSEEKSFECGVEDDEGRSCDGV